MSFLIRHNRAEDTDTLADRDSFDETIAEHLKSGNPDTGETAEPLPTSSSSVIKFYPEWCTCFGSTALQYPTGENATFRGLVRYLCQCPPFGPVARITVFLSIFAMAWLILSFLIGPVAGLRGPIFAIIILEIIGLFTGMTMKLFGLPTLLAPLILGIILRNVNALDIFEYFKYPFDADFCERTFIHSNLSSDKATLATCCQKFGTTEAGHWIGPIREIALTLILTRAGTELSPKQLRKLKGVVPALAFIPCVTEAVVCAVLFYICFPALDPPITLCLVAGFAIAAVSPAVVVPGMLSLARKGYGILQGVPTLLIAASSIDDVLAISLYTIFISIAFTGGKEDTDSQRSHVCDDPYIDVDDKTNIPNWLQLAGGPLGVIIGIVYGAVAGMILHFLPSRDTKGKGNMRLVLLLCCNLSCMLGFSSTEFLAGAGSLGVLTTSFVASFGWRSQPHWKKSMHEVEGKLTHMWTLFVPILFGTIGKEMRFTPDSNDQYFSDEDRRNLTQLNELHPFDAGNIGRVIGIIVVCLVVRCVVTFFIVGFAGLNKRERLFVALAWIPKATVQAALAPLVLTTVIEKEVKDVTIKTLSMHIVVTAVFAILLTAPLGAVLIALTGPRLLQKVKIEEIEEEFPNGEPDPEEEEEELQTGRARGASINPSTRGSILGILAVPSTVDSFVGSSTVLPEDSMGGQSATSVGTLSRIASTASGAPGHVSVGSKGDTGLPPDIP